jgi:hypothetical protein
MASNKREILGPVALTTTLTTNVFAPAAAGASAVGYTATASYILIYRLSIANKTASAATATLYKTTTGANTAGTELCLGLSVAANSVTAIDFPGGLRLEGAGGFIVGGSGTATALTITATAEIGLV